ncbi:hypothetical protein EG329_012048 [Mollisiaceae sp. DMI_Dod_QoI]|nr:hypothetical protein EG329_012048 [Helotiales sp. DMI_Dod_QoI]
MEIPAHFGFAYITPLHHDIYPSIDPTSSSLSQPEKIVLITGAGKGIGRSIALSYAHANVSCLILLSRTLSDLSSLKTSISTINPQIRVLTFAVDVTCPSSISKIAEEVKTKEGRLDILINNAGHSTPWVPLPESPVDDYWRTIEVNLKGPFLLLHAFLPLLKETGERTGKGTDVVNVTSIGAHAIHPGGSAYQISKFALLRLTEFVDVEFGDQAVGEGDGEMGKGMGKGVRCFSVHPGGVKTELTAKSVEAVRRSEFFFSSILD